MVKKEKVFVINLDDKKHLYEKFTNLDADVERISAVDSRQNHYAYKDYGLSLDPVGLTSKFYFSESFGAVGCYLSHYLIWESMINRNISSALILEDDANIKDVANFIAFHIQFVKSALLKTDRFPRWDLIQLNTRTPNQFLRSHGASCNLFNGTESYYLSLKGAEKLFSLTHDRDCFQGIIKDEPFEKHQLDNAHPNCFIYPQQYEMYQNEPPQDWTRKDSITCAVDKFIGYCSDPKLPRDKFLSTTVIPAVNLSEEGLTSDIEPDRNPFWNCNEKELIERQNSENFMWWNK